MPSTRTPRSEKGHGNQSGSGAWIGNQDIWNHPLAQVTATPAPLAKPTAPAAAYDRALASQVRDALKLAEASEPTTVAALRGVLNDARHEGVLDDDMLGQVQAILAQHKPAAPAGRRNRYAAACVTCGQPVPAEAGWLAKGAGGKWAAQHEGACPEAVVIIAPADPEARGGTWETVADGYYATPSRTGNNDLDFWRVATVAEGEWAGFRGVKRVIGGRTDEKVRGAERHAALTAIALDPAAAGMAYAEELGACRRCNRHLTDETSRAAGIGPECATKD